MVYVLPYRPFLSGLNLPLCHSPNNSFLPLFHDLDLPSSSVPSLYCRSSSPSGAAICPYSAVSPLFLRFATTLHLPLVWCSHLFKSWSPSVASLVALSPSRTFFFLPLHFVEVWFWCGFDHYLCWISKCCLQSWVFPTILGFPYWTFISCYLEFWVSLFSYFLIICLLKYMNCLRLLAYGDTKQSTTVLLYSSGCCSVNGCFN